MVLDICGNEKQIHGFVKVCKHAKHIMLIISLTSDLTFDK